MNPDQKTRLLIGTLVSAVIIVLVYGLFRELNPPQVPVVQAATQIVSAAPIAAPAPRAPLLRIESESPVTANTGGHAATIRTNEDLSYEWSIQGGTIEGIATSASITWTAGTGTEVVLTCKGTNTADQSSTAALKVRVRQPPTIARFEAEPKVITVGSSTKLSWSASDTQKLILEPSGQDVSKHNGPAMEVKPEKTTVYTLTATNSTSVIATRELQVKVVPPPEITAFRAEPVAGSATAFTVIGEFKAGKAELKNGSQIVTSSETSPLRIEMADLKVGSTLVLTVTNEAGTYLASTLNFAVKKP